MFSENLRVTAAAVHGIEPAFVFALVGTDVAVEAFRRAVRRALEASKIDLVAIVTGICFLGVCGLQGERQAGEEEGERADELAHGDARCSGFIRRSGISSNYEPTPVKSQYSLTALNTDFRVTYTWSIIGLVLAFEIFWAGLTH